jgi:O-antigen/teichoic acid export membrane protein
LGIIQKQSFYSSLTLGLGIILGFVTSGILLPNYFTEEQNGLLTLLNSYSLIYSQFALMGLTTVIIRYYPHVKNNPSHGFFNFILLLGTIGFSLFLVFYYLSKSYFKEIFERSPLFSEFYFLLVPWTLFILFFYLFDAYATAMKKTVRGFVMKDVIQRILIILAIFWFIMHSSGNEKRAFTDFILQYSAIIGFVTLLMFIPLIREKELSLSFQFTPTLKPFYKEMSRVAGYSFLLGISYVGVTNIDAIMIERYISLEAAGIYGRNMFFGIMVALPYRILHKSSSGLLSEKFKENDVNEISNIYYKSCLNQLIIGCFLFCVIWINIDHIYEIIPKSYEEGKYVIFFIGLGSLINMAGGVNTAVISFSPYFRWNTYFSIILLVLIVITNMAFIPLYGITGAAVATTISLFLYNLGMYILLKLRYNFQPFNIKHLLVIIYSLLGIFVCIFIPNFSNFIIDTLIKSTVFSILFGLLIFGTKISPDMNQFIEFMWKKVSKQKN